VNSSSPVMVAFKCKFPEMELVEGQRAGGRHHTRLALRVSAGRAVVKLRLPDASCSVCAPNVHCEGLDFPGLVRQALVPHR
jgi:hypothetical protein